MKNLKKVLALALAFAMSLTLFAGAAYTDEASIGVDYADSVAMLSQLGVVGGYEDGSFRPQGNITRAETTKLIYVLKYGYDDAGKLFAGAPSTFTDVEGNANVSWAKGYINYCANQGIVGGIGNKKFNPNGNVTVAELSKMLLVSLGADAIKEGYGGSNWAANVVADAMEFGVFDGWTGDPTLPATRELACKLMANTIFAPIYTYNPMTGIGSQYETGSTKNQTLGEKTMGLKHVNGIVAANGRYALDTNPEGKPFGVTVNPIDEKTVILEELTAQDGTVTYKPITIDVDLSDDHLGNIVDVYYKDVETTSGSKVKKIVGDVLVNSKTVVYEAMAADIEFTPDGESTSKKEVKPSLNFTTADGEVISIAPRASWDATNDKFVNEFNKYTVKQDAAYKGAAFADRMYVFGASATSPDTFTLTQPEFEAAAEGNGYNPGLTSTGDVKAAVEDIGKNQLRSYRFVSVDGGLTYSYIFASARMDFGKVGTYNDTTISVSGAGGTLDLEDEVIVADGVEKGMYVVTSAKDGKVVIEPTVNVSGKATNLRDDTATIAGSIYRAAVAELGAEIDAYFITGAGKNKNNDSTTYITYKNHILKIDATAVTGSATDYAVVLMSKVDEDTGVVTVKLGFADNSEGTYEVSKLCTSETDNEKAKTSFENNKMVGAVIRAKVSDGSVNLTGNSYTSTEWANKATAANDKSTEIASIADNTFKAAGKSYRADDSSVVFMLYGGTKGDNALAGDKATGTLYALKSKAYKLADVADTATKKVWVKAAIDTDASASNQAIYMGDAVGSTTSTGMTVLLAGSISVGENASAGITDVENVAYIVKTTERYNADTENYYIDVVMIAQDGMIDTRTVDNVMDDANNVLVTGNSGKEVYKQGTIVLYEMTASEDAADTREWIQTLGTNGTMGQYNYIYKDQAIGDNGYYAVQIAEDGSDYIGYFKAGHTQTGAEENWADSMLSIKKDKYEYAVIAIDDNTFIEGGDIATISNTDEISGDLNWNAVICVSGGKVVRVFSLHNNI